MGNWFPRAFKPQFPIYSEEEAIEIASELYKEDIQKEFWTNGHEHFEYSIQKIYTPVRFDDKIEILECWYIKAELHMFYEIYIDTQTGEILRSISYNPPV